MPNIVEFIIKMQDGLSGPLAVSAKNSGAAKSALDRLTDSNKKLKNMLGPTGKSINEISNRIAKLKEYRNMLPEGAEKQIKAVNAEMEKLNRQMGKMQTMNGSKVKGWFKDAFTGLPAMLKNPVVLAAVGAGVLFKKAFSQGLKNSKDKLDLQNLVGKKQGSVLSGQLRKQRKRTGEGTMGAAKGLLSGGVGSDEVSPMIEQLGNVAAGDAGKLTALAGAFGKMRQEGKLTEGTLTSMMDSGFKPLLLMSENTGESMASLEKRLADGKIGYDEVADSLENATDKGGQFYGVLDRMNSGPIGALDRMKTSFSDAAGVLGDKLMPLAETVFGVLSDGIDGTVSLMRDLAKWGRENEGVLSVLAGAVTAGAVAWGLYAVGVRAAWMWQQKDLVMTALMTTAQGINALVTGGAAAAWTGLTAAMAANPIGIVVVAIGALVGGIAVAWNKFEGFRKVVYGLWETTKEVFTSIGRLFKKIFSPIGEAIKAIQDRNWTGLAKAAGKMILNLSPVGLIMNTKEFVEDGGFDNVKGAYKRGEEKGAASWAASQKKKKEGAIPDNAVEQKRLDEEKKRLADLKSTGRGAADTKAGINAVSGGGSKNITLTIGKLVEKLEINVKNGVSESIGDMERMIEEGLVRALASASGR